MSLRMRLSQHLFLTIFINIFLISQVHSQNVKGRLTDSKNNPVPYVAVYDETTYVGTTSNTDGYYDLKLEAGEHSIVYKALGYYLVRRQITTSNQTVVLDIQVREQTVDLDAVVIRPDKEDPAYAIMRKTIGLAPYHLNQVKEYVADVYLRGHVHVVKIPNIIARNIEIDGKKNLIKNGDVFLDESLNEITFHAPDKYDQKALSFHNKY